MNHRRPSLARRLGVPTSRCGLAIVAFGCALAAQSGAWATDTAAPGLGGRVFSFGTWQGQLFAGGHAFAAKGGEIAGLARWDGDRWQPVGSGVDLVGGYASFAAATVRTMCEFRGELIVAGTFDVAGGQPRNNIARWNGAAFEALGQGLVEIGWDADIRAMAVFNNELYVAGTFDLAGGLPANGIARWNGTSWSTCGTGLAGFGAGLDGHGESLLVVGNELLVGGDFYYANGVPAQCIARWNGATFLPMGPGFDGAVHALALHGGQVVAAGSFSFSGTTPVYGVAAWNGIGWQLLAPGGPTPTITSLQTLGGLLYASGDFAAPGAGVARFDGIGWSGIGGVAGVFSGNIPTVVLALGVHGTDLLVGGEFTRGGNPPQGSTAVVSTNVIAFDGASWRQMGSGRGVHGIAAKVLSYGADWLAVGAFEEAGGVAASAIARYDGDAWRHMATFDGDIVDAVVYRGDLVVSGSFATIDGQPIQRMARFDGSSWSQFGPPLLVSLAVHGDQLYASGTAALRQWSGSGWVDVAPVGGIVEDLHVHRDGNLYFTTSAFGSYLVYRWDGVTATQIGAANNLTHSLGSFGNDLLVGGRFTAIGSTPANLLARWNGVAWSALGAGVTGFAVESMCEVDGQLYVGISGDPRGFLLRWNGATWQAVPGNLDGLPAVLFPDRATASVLAFGGMHGAAGKPVWNLGEWRNRPRWQNRLHGLPGTAGAPLLRGDGTLVAGSALRLDVDGPPSHLAVLGIGFSRLDVPLFGGLLVPSPDFLAVLIGGASGSSNFTATWPVAVPAGTSVFVQAWLLDATGPQGWTATNALQATTP